MRLRRALGYALPYGLHVIRARRASRARLEREAAVAASARADKPTAFSAEQAIAFLVDRGLDEQAVREGSMPATSLDFAADLLRQRLPTAEELLLLHVGNFVGVSLGYLTWLARELHPDSLVVSVDPNIRHRGIDNPQDHALALLGRFDLLANSLVVPGYTLEQNFGDRWSDDPEIHREEAACEQVLRSLIRLCGESRFDVVLIDGNHDAGYLARELALASELLKPDGILVVDDVDVERWPGVSEGFRRALESGAGAVVELGQDGRVGVLQRQGHPLRSGPP